MNGVLVARRYRLGRRIGTGGMGRVWLAVDEVLRREVAIKEVMLPDGLSDEEAAEMRQRTLREGRTAGVLDHPNVIKVYDVIYAENRPWIVMEYVESRSLAQVLKDDGPRSPEEAARIGVQVLDALVAAHRANVLHRDVKPGNVLLGRARVVLTDFGLATFDDMGSALTASGVVHGSPQYIAPERALDGTSTPASDMWSLGATLYAAVEGRAPYARNTSYATLTALATSPPDPPKRAGALKPVLQGLLKRNPAARTRPEELREQLVTVAEGGTVPHIPAQRRRSDPNAAAFAPAPPGRSGTGRPAGGNQGRTSVNWSTRRPGRRPGGNATGSGFDPAVFGGDDAPIAGRAPGTHPADGMPTSGPGDDPAGRAQPRGEVAGRGGESPRHGAGPRGRDTGSSGGARAAGAPARGTGQGADRDVDPPGHAGEASKGGVDPLDVDAPSTGSGQTRSGGVAYPDLARENDTDRMMDMAWSGETPVSSPRRAGHSAHSAPRRTGRAGRMHGAPTGPLRRHRWLTAAVCAVVVAGGTVAVVLATHHHPRTGTPSPATSTGSGSGSGGADGFAVADLSWPCPLAQPVSAQVVHAAGGDDATFGGTAAPPNSTWFRFPDGVHGAIPIGWRYQSAGDRYCFHDAGTQVIGYESWVPAAGTTPAGALATMINTERGTLPGYHQVSVDHTPFSGVDAAAWTYTFTGSIGGLSVPMETKIVIGFAGPRLAFAFSYTTQRASFADPGAILGGLEVSFVRNL